MSTCDCFELLFRFFQRLPFVDVATGSLGQGLSCAAGMAYVGKYIDHASWALTSLRRFNSTTCILKSFTLFSQNADVVTCVLYIFYIIFVYVLCLTFLSDDVFVVLWFFCLLFLPVIASTVWWVTERVSRGQCGRRCTFPVTTSWTTWLQCLTSTALDRVKRPLYSIEWTYTTRDWRPLGVRLVSPDWLRLDAVRGLIMGSFVTEFPKVIFYILGLMECH